MRKLVLVLLLLSSCSFKRQPVMSLGGYQTAHVGMSEDNLLKFYGDPIRVRHLDSGVTIYQYEERFQVGSVAPLQVRRYYFFFKNGQLVSKQMRLYDRPGPTFEDFGWDDFNFPRS